TLTKLRNNNRVIILKSRQLGISTLTAAYSLWYMIFNEYKSIYTVATKTKVAKNLVDKVRLMHANLPSWLKPECVEDNKLNMKYSNGSSISAGSSSSDEGRSEAISVFLIDECGFVPNVDQLWAAIQPTVSTGGTIIMLSTPNGVGNLFHRTWVDAEANKNDFCGIELPWQVHPERDEKWRRQQDIELGARNAKQECDCSFLSTGDAVFDGEKLEEYISKYQQEPIEKPLINKDMWIWKFPEEGHRYLLAADTARGDANDSSAIHIIDIDEMEQVAEYSGKISTTQLANLCINYATIYNDAIVIPENTGIGWATVQSILDRGTKNLFYSTDNMKYRDESKYKTNDKKKSVPGFTMSAATRPLCIDKMIINFENEYVKIRSSRLLNQMKVFVWQNGKAQAMSGYNDDLVLAMSIGLYVRDISILKSANMNEVNKQLLSSIMVSYNTIEDKYKRDYMKKNIIRYGNFTEDISGI
ncbi:MAG TPA: terminase family protein, partial [Thermotogota bacterium]|nr:terminase family protein [Thermotogota bacterium]